MIKKNSPSSSLKKATIISFLIIGFLYGSYYALHLYYSWSYLKWDFQHITLTLPISTATIMGVFLPPEFRAILYLIITATLILTTAFYVRKKYRLPDACKKGIVIAFFTSALIYAIHADIIWTKWLLNDFRNFDGLSTEDKLLKTEDKFFPTDDNLYEFALKAKNYVDDDYEIYSPYEYAPKRAEYFLLPLKRRNKIPYMKENVRYIIVMGDTEAKYDPKLRMFTRGKSTISNVDLVFMFAQNAYILKIL